MATLHRSFPAAARAFYPLPSTSRNLAEQNYPSLRHSPDPGAAREVTTQGFFLQSTSPLWEALAPLSFSLSAFPSEEMPSGTTLEFRSYNTHGAAPAPAVTGHKTPHLFVPAAGATLRVGTDPTPSGDVPIEEPGAEGTDPEGKQGKKNREYFL